MAVCTAASTITSISSRIRCGCRPASHASKTRPKSELCGAHTVARAAIDIGKHRQPRRGGRFRIVRHRRSHRGRRGHRRRPPRPAARRCVARRPCRSRSSPATRERRSGGPQTALPRWPTISRPPREGCKPTSPEPPATSLARSAGGACGCGVEVGVGGDFLPCASDVRSARAERERPVEARAEGCEQAKEARDARAGAKDGRWGGAPHWRDRLLTTDEEDVQQSRPGRRN